ncbi:DUF1194 domain-containing protein [Polymorphum gilvum]|uniref:Hypothetical conserved protein n=1 Tax=Polymorphum gilvum (strain LMG 25793 / CGMCC 1.9160 / SL003B-26A1) TaxID=991905 RepID=F2J2U3_POLGS|nr:DUF1194 domain-containing protein [Polymorphum gilvum]ADZ72117.1 Hypothetical conserved protein [Polymorphum gilvum SL003B-26A1]
MPSCERSRADTLVRPFALFGLPGRAAAAVAVVLVAMLAPAALDGAKADEVDVAIVLAVDISYSMDEDELRLQRSGYIDAVTSGEVLAAIRGGLVGRIALAYVEWAGALSQATLIDWHVVDDAASAETFASALAEAPIRRAYRTAIGDALLYSAAQFERLPHDAMRRVIDISGDGPNNQGTLAPLARDMVIRDGIVINGLPLVMKERGYSLFDIVDLDRYYRDCVTGGAGSFVIPIRSEDAFAESIRRKLVLEIAGVVPEVVPEVVPGDEPVRIWRAADGIDPFCLIGERLWQQRMRNLDP